MGDVAPASEAWLPDRPSHRLFHKVIELGGKVIEPMREECILEADEATSMPYGTGPGRYVLYANTSERF